jgi:hypothetical protein
MDWIPAFAGDGQQSEIRSSLVFIRGELLDIAIFDVSCYHNAFEV